MAKTADHGVFNGKMVDASSHKLIAMKPSSVVKPMPQLKNDPSNDAMRAIRSMRVGNNESWSSNAEKAIRQHVK